MQFTPVIHPISAFMRLYLHKLPQISPFSQLKQHPISASMVIFASIFVPHFLCLPNLPLPHSTPFLQVWSFFDPYLHFHYATHTPFLTNDQTVAIAYSKFAPHFLYLSNFSLTTYTPFLQVWLFSPNICTPFLISG
ncbi:hypothetical protein [Anabaena azotica]|uniref:Uncharacterized protein n=1 Tax=Anabaena azotica FACHB-119 TaxID=947527 RepID=A0ABR8DG53_9NOST|nr:hypothetical protein [Anabaena azotica]MBD2505513.1 hypothetical protein [Anabaena azotica FACHB-119]